MEGSFVVVVCLFFRSVPNDVYIRVNTGYDYTELRSFVKVEMAVLGSPSLISLNMVSEVVKPH